MRYVLVLVTAGIIAVLVCMESCATAAGLVKPVNLEKINTDADEEDPCLSPDGYSLLYASKVKGSYDIYISKRTQLNVPFPSGKTLIADSVADERSPFFYQGKYYFASNQVVDDKLSKFKNFDLFMQIGFQAPLYVPGDINSKVDEMYPWITASGKEFYFSRKTEDGWKQFVANGPVPGPIGKARPLDFPVGFHHATLSSTALTMYLQGPLEEGRIGIFRSKRAKIGAAWSMPEPWAALHQHDGKRGDMQPALNADGTRLYFVSDRPGGKGGLDIWAIATSQFK